VHLLGGLVGDDLVVEDGYVVNEDGVDVVAVVAEPEDNVG
jgi:translation initiation factor 2B subunit (eIF-2B alpha/beta/delta family)